jgi:chloramphenicol-sensitive protein RarD
MNRHDRPADHSARSGVFALFGAFAIWGLLPLYLHALREIAPLQIMAYRLVLCCAVVLTWLRLRGELRQVTSALAVPNVRVRLAASANLISVNWLCFVWAVTNDHVVEASLGYFMTPLLNVLLGVLFLHEQLRKTQWIAVGFAAIGVGYLTWLSGSPPFIALALAGSFGTYGVLRKTVAVDAMAGLGAETLLITPLGAAYLIVCEVRGTGAITHSHSGLELALLSASGVVTAVPLWLFAYGARRVPYATVGLVGYLGPSLQLLLGVVILHEAFDQQRMFGFAFIWAGLIVYSADALLRSRA